MFEILREVEELRRVILATGSREHHREGAHQNLNTSKVT